MTATLSAATRARDLVDLAEGPAIDVLVIGGGITGVGVALDAAARGLSVVLVERRDLAFGTSRWSSKLVHGGLRYLASGQLGVAYESARERHALMTAIAPHLVRPLAFVVPLNADLDRVGGALARAGLVVGEGLRAAARTPTSVLPRFRRISDREARALVPRLGPTRGALVHWDGQLIDDARLVIAVARTAAAHGARILTRTLAVSVDSRGADLRDEMTGESLRIGARQVVVATGVFAGELVETVKLRPSRGTHLVVRASALGDPQGALNVIVPGTNNRWVFALPQPDPYLAGADTVLVGLTDDPIDGLPTEIPEAGPNDETFLLRVLSAALDREVRPDDVVGRFSGLRPLVAGGSSATADLSRRHALVRDPGTDALALVGGKLTTYRAMAEQAVDAVVARLGRGGPSRTRHIPLVGAAPRARLATIRAPERLVRRYGVEAEELVRLADGRPELLSPVAPGLAVLGVEFVFGVRHEGAMLVEDLLERRTRLGLVRSAAESARDAAAEALAELSTTPA